MKFYVYEIRDQEQLLYVGKGLKEGKYDRIRYYTNGYYKTHNRWIDNKLKKLDSFEVNILERFENEQEAIDREVELIQELKPLCNLTLGGDGISGYRHTEEDKAAMTGPGREISIANLKKAVEANTGKSKLDKYTKEHIVEICTQYGVIEGSKRLGVSFPTLRRWMNRNGLEGFRSEHQSKASRRNLKKAVEANTGAKYSEERKRKISESNKKYHQNKKR